jgi:hypothetical protein
MSTKLDKFFQPRPTNWFRTNTTFFDNLHNYNEKKGNTLPTILNPSKFKEKCFSDCKQLGFTGNHNNCHRYCTNRLYEHQKSVNSIKQNCPNGDPICCKRAAQDNDFGYLGCINRNYILSSNSSNSSYYYFIIIMVSIFFLLLFILFCILFLYK